MITQIKIKQPYINIVMLVRHLWKTQLLSNQMELVTIKTLSEKQNQHQKTILKKKWWSLFDQQTEIYNGKKTFSSQISKYTLSSWTHRNSKRIILTNKIVKVTTKNSHLYCKHNFLFHKVFYVFVDTKCYDFEDYKIGFVFDDMFINKTKMDFSHQVL